MSGTHPTRLIITTTITSLLSIACFVVGYFVNIWWTTENIGIKTTTGLWRTCSDYQNGTVTCEDRTNILSFKNEKGTDPIIICLMISTGFSVLIVFSSLSVIICCRRKPTTWYKTIQWMTFLIIISFVSAVDGMLYTELEFKDELSNATRGWAYMVSWVGAGLQFCTFLLVIVQLCVRPPPIVETHGWQ